MSELITSATARIGRARTWQNWGRSVTAAPAFTATASTPDEVAAAVCFARERDLPLKPIGAGHSFTAIAATSGVLLDLSPLDGVLAVDGTLVTFGAGTNLYQVPALLAPYGLAFENLGDIDRQTIAGATSTGTHGTGAHFTGIADRIRALTLVTASGELVRISATENAELLPAAALGLGALGVIVDVTIECVPAFLLHAVERPEPVDRVLAELPERLATTDHFEFYVWPHTDTVLSKTNTRLPIDHERRPLGTVSKWFDDEFLANGVYRVLLNAELAAPALVPPINQLSVKLQGDREYTDLSTNVFTSNRTVRFREQEYAIPVEHLAEAVCEVRSLIERRGWRISFPIEVRAAAADSLMLSTASGRASGYIAVHRYYREDPTEYFAEVERIMLAYGGRPHWGKMHTMDAASLRAAYPRFDEFLAVRDRLDPERVFANEYLARVLGP